jgi:multidrug resistance efflux pump
MRIAQFVFRFGHVPNYLDQHRFGEAELGDDHASRSRQSIVRISSLDGGASARCDQAEGALERWRRRMPKAEPLHAEHLERQTELAKLETKLAEAQTQIARLKQLWSVSAVRLPSSSCQIC